MDFVFDRDDTHQRQFDQLLPELKEMSMMHGRLVDAVRKSRTQFIPLQAADLLAWQTRRAFSATQEPRRAHYDSARNAPPLPAETFILDRTMLGIIISDIRDHAANLAQYLGRNANVRTW